MKNFNEGKSKCKGNYGWINPKLLKSPNSFYTRKENEEKLKKLKKWKGKNPIECLEINGFQVLTDTKGKIIVGVDKSIHFSEGIDSPRKIEDGFTKEQLYSISKEKIKDYNSLWELTNSGWDSVGNTIYPYIFLTKKGNKEIECWRWDNSNFLRVNSLTHNWNEENFQKYFKSKSFQWMVNNQPSKQNSPINEFRKLGRNEKCWCGSGLKYKKCCRKEI